MKLSNKKSLTFLLGAAILVIVLFYVASYVNLEAFESSPEIIASLEKNVNILESDLEKTRTTGDPQENLNLIENDLKYIKMDLDSLQKSQSVDDSNHASSGVVPNTNSSNFTSSASPANITVPTITTAALMTPKPAAATTALSTTRPVQQAPTTALSTTRPVQQAPTTALSTTRPVQQAQGSIAQQMLRSIRVG